MLLRVEDWARDKEPTEVTEEVGLCWWRGLWEWTEPSLLDLNEPYSGGGWYRTWGTSLECSLPLCSG